MTREQIYWYARGYYEARAYGTDEGVNIAYNDEMRHAYRIGYDAGVHDYCELDERTCEEEA